MLYPFSFQPIFKERIWGARNLGRLYNKPLPAGVPIGESWEISDRPGDVSVVANGPLAGKDLHWLMEHHERELLGAARSAGGRFPLLVKILDAADKLSLQVHPPSAAAAALGGEPKTEMWYITEARAGAELFVGLRPGVTRIGFEHSIGNGSVSACFHRVAVKPGDVMFLPSGRVHAIGAGNVLFEIQQNSDTTYRVHDWNRVDASGQPRALHVKESLASIDFADFEPALLRAAGAEQVGGAGGRDLVNDPLFRVTERRLEAGAVEWNLEDRPLVVGVVTGGLQLSGSAGTARLREGEFALVPASLGKVRVECADSTTALCAAPG